MTYGIREWDILLKKFCPSYPVAFGISPDSPYQRTSSRVKDVHKGKCTLNLFRHQRQEQLLRLSLYIVTLKSSLLRPITNTSTTCLSLMTSPPTPGLSFSNRRVKPQTL